MQIIRRITVVEMRTMLYNCSILPGSWMYEYASAARQQFESAARQQFESACMGN